MKRRMNQSRMTPGAFVLRLVLVWMIVTFVIFPNINIIINVLQEDGKFSTEAFTKLLSSKRAVKSMINSLILGVSLVITVNVVGTLTVLFTEYWDLRGSKLLKLSYMTSLIYGGVVLATGYKFVYGAKGIVTKLLLMIMPELNPNWFSGFGAVLFVMTFACTSNHIIFLTNAIRALDYHVIEAAQNLGASDSKILFKVVLPSLKPTLFALTIMTFLTGICALSAPLMIGGTKFQTINPMIMSFAQAPGSRDLAAVLAIFLGLVTMILLYFMNRVERKGNYISISKTKEKMKKQKIRNPVANVLAHVAAYTMFLIYMLPICCVVIFSFCDTLAIKTSTLSLSSFTLQNYIHLFTKPSAFRPYLVSIVYSVAAAVIAGVICVIVARLVLKSKNKFDSFFEYGLLIPWMLPTTFIALGLMFTFDSPRFLVGNKVLVGSIWIMLIAYVVVKLPFSFRMIRAAFFGVEDSLEEAAKTMGASTPYALVKVVLPVILPTVTSVIALNFNSLLSDFDLSVFLYSPKYQPLGVIIKAASDEGVNENAQAMALVYSVVLMILCGLALWLTQGGGAAKIRAKFRQWRNR